MQKEDFFQLDEESKLADSILAKPALLLPLDRFGITLGLGDHTVKSLCEANGINISVFLYICNLYVSGSIPGSFLFPGNGLTTLIDYLQRSHYDYMNEIYPELQNQIVKLKAGNQDKSVRMVETFFTEYMQEVKEHLDFENEIVFPYIVRLQQPDFIVGTEFSVVEYKNHHNDIEEKLTDLKNLLIRYLPVQNDSIARRKLLNLLFDLEYDLHIHSLVEGTVLIPLVEKIEMERDR